MILIRKNKMTFTEQRNYYSNVPLVNEKENWSMYKKENDRRRNQSERRRNSVVVFERKLIRMHK